IDVRTVKTHRTAIYRCPSRTGGATDFAHGHPAAGSTFNFTPARTTHIRTVVIHIRVVDDGGAVIYPYPIPIRCIVAIQPRAGNVTLRYEYPMVMRDADVHINAHLRT